MIRPREPGNLMSITRFLFGRPLASSEEGQEKIGPATGVAALGLDGLSSSAYGPEAALTVLLPLGVAGLWYIQPLTLAILVLLALLYLSYRQTIAAYPVNGGSYTVAKENLGTHPSLLAAASLLVDYILNVAVGISAGIAALVSAVPQLHPFTLPLCLAVLAVITLANLRGTKEAGWAFALPTYLFIVSLGSVLLIGIVKAIAGGGHPEAVVAPPELPAAAESVSLWLLLRAFATGCTAMTGVEAVSNGVSAFQEPTVVNARRTLTAIVALLAVLLGAIAFLAHAYGIGAMDQNQPGYQSVLSQLTAAVLGRGWFYYLTIGNVLAILALSANTSFVDFPRLCRLIAEDDFLPRSFAIVGRRLVATVGVVFLSLAAGALLVAFDGVTDRLIPLFAAGAFTAFTLSQAGMVVHWQKQLRGAAPNQDAEQDEKRSRRSSLYLRMATNGVGAAATAVALTIILATKFMEGAWVTILTIAALIVLFKLVHRQYRKLDAQTVSYRPLEMASHDVPVVLLAVRCWDRPTEKSLRFALWLSTDIFAVHLLNVGGNGADGEEEQIKRQWKENVEIPAQKAGLPVPKLVVAPSKYRLFCEPLLHEIDQLKREFHARPIAVIIPEVVSRHWWEPLLHVRRAASLRMALRNRGEKRVVVISMPWYLRD